MPIAALRMYVSSSMWRQLVVAHILQSHSRYDTSASQAQHWIRLARSEQAHHPPQASRDRSETFGRCAPDLSCGGGPPLPHPPCPMQGNPCKYFLLVCVVSGLVRPTPLVSPFPSSPGVWSTMPNGSRDRVSKPSFFFPCCPLVPILLVRRESRGTHTCSYSCFCREEDVLWYLYSQVSGMRLS